VIAGKGRSLSTETTTETVPHSVPTRYPEYEETSEGDDRLAAVAKYCPLEQSLIQELASLVIHTNNCGKNSGETTLVPDLRKCLKVNNA